MKLKHIPLDQLKTTPLNVRKRGGKDIDDILPSIRALGILQPLLVRPNCEGYEIVAGQRRYHALTALAAERETEGQGKTELVPCLVMKDGDDAAAIEASLAENIARLPMDEIDQYKAFAALIKKGKSVEDIAGDFGISERLVRQRLAIANLIAPILTAYRKDEIDSATVRTLTMASKSQQQEWWRLHTSEDEYAPRGRQLKSWLFGGGDIPVTNALFAEAEYDGAIITDLFGDHRYFDDAAKFWTLQNKAVSDLDVCYRADSWQDVTVLDIGQHFAKWEHVKRSKRKGGKVFIEIGHDGQVTCHEGYVTAKEAKALDRTTDSDAVIEPKAAKPEITKAMQNYLDLHRHATVRLKLLAHPDIALRLAIAQVIGGSSLWDVKADRQRSNSEAIGESLAASPAQTAFDTERQAIRALLGIEIDGTLVSHSGGGFDRPDLHDIFGKLLRLDNDAVQRIFTFVVAETLPSGDALVEALGVLMKVDMAETWKPDDIFLDLLRDKEALSAIIGELAGRATADAHKTSTAKIRKKIIADCLSGSRTCRNPDWLPRYMSFPMQGYIEHGGIRALDEWSAIKPSYE